MFLGEIMKTVVVGICTQNCENSIKQLVTRLDKAIVKNFPNDSFSILCADGFSKDNTRKLFNETSTKTEKKFMTEKGKKGKGSAIRTILQRAKGEQADAVYLIDGDFLNWKEHHLTRMLNPVLKGTANVAIPHYNQDKHDALIENHLIYPLTKVLFNTNLRRPLSGEVAMNLDAYSQLMYNQFFTDDHGISTCFSIVSLCEQMGLAEVKVGCKDHGSSEFHAQPEVHLMPVFNQVLRNYISLLRYYKTSIRREVKNDYKKLGRKEEAKPKKIAINIDNYLNLSRGTIKSREDYVKAVYTAINKQSIMGLKVAWLNWLSLYFDSVKKMSNEKAEKELDLLVKEFAKHKEMLKL